MTLRKGIVRAQANYRATRQRRLYKDLQLELRKRVETESRAQERHRLRSAQEERDNQDHAAKTAAGFNQLEIPVELAFIYNKMDGRNSDLPDSMIIGLNKFVRCFRLATNTHGAECS